MANNSLAISIVINAPIEKIWAEIADWNNQGKWMLQTKVWTTSEITEGVGTSIAAFTGPLYKIYPRFSYLGILDLMTVTSWSPPISCDVIHTGAIIKGTGRFELTHINSEQVRFDWSEVVVAPRALFLALVPALYLGVRLSLRRFKARCE